MNARFLGVAALGALACTVALSGCSNDSDGNSGTDAGADAGGDGGGGETRALVGVFGSVVDTAGAPIAGATVDVGGTTATTDASGAFMLETSPADGVIAGVGASGYLPVFLSVDVLDGTASRLDFTLMAMAAPVTVDITAGGEASGERGATVVIPEGALVDAAGVAVTGEVQVMLTPYDPSIEAEFRAYPGSMTAERLDGSSTALVSWGVLDVTIMQDGAELDVADGMFIEARIPVPADGPAPPETTTLWSFDEVRGIWIEEGVATLDADAGVYVAALPHLSPWNCDDPSSVTCLEGLVVDGAGAPVAGARVRVVGVSVFGSSEVTTNSQGEFCAFAPPSADVRMSVIHGDGGGVITDVATGSETFADDAACGVGQCLDVGSFTVVAGELVIEDPSGGGGTTVDCASVGNPFAGTCAEGLSDMFECFGATGACEYTTGSGDGSGSITYASGSRIETSFSGGSYSASYYGPTGTLCGTGSVNDPESGAFQLQNADGRGPWTMVERGADQVLVCPDGTEIIMSTVEFDSFQACLGAGEGNSECTLDTGGGTVDLCSQDSDCAAGEACCNVGGNNICAAEETCANFCSADTDCTGGQVCCTISGIQTCVDQATCDAASGCASDADCASGEECCNISGFSACIPEGSCPN